MSNKLYLTDEYFKEKLDCLDYQEYIKLKYQFRAVTCEFSIKIANIVKKWAIENGAKYLAHLFFPLNNATAQKYVRLEENSPENLLIMEQADASSFVQFGKVKTHTACGYIRWDIASKAFIQTHNFGKVLYLPSFFCDYKGNYLDYKMPLARSCRAINNSATRLLNLLGEKHIDWVISNVGLEQEFFLLDKSINNSEFSHLGCRLGNVDYNNSYNNYYLKLPNRVAVIMKKVEQRLNNVGISVSVFHSEVSPNQYEIVPKYTNCQTSAEDNIFLVETLKDVAKQCNMLAVINEKPFKDINGSGKHNNWSIMSSSGQNLIDPEQSNSQIFLVFFTAVLCAMKKHYNLLMSAVTSVDNSYRLGGNEAPQSSFSVYVGEDLYKALVEFVQTKKWQLNKRKKLKGYPVEISVDICNRNRTSTFAFTGSKFEFRAVGASQNPMLVNTFINTIVAEQLCQIADELQGKKDINSILIEKLKDAMDIVFNKNCYSPRWKLEANKRRLKDYKNSPQIYDELLSSNTLQMFKKHKVYTKTEVRLLNFMLKTNYVNQTYKRANIILNAFRQELNCQYKKYQYNIPNELKNLSKSQFQIINKMYQDINRTVNEVEKLVSVQNKNINIKTQMCYQNILPLLDKCCKLYNNLQNYTKNV